MATSIGFILGFIQLLTISVVLIFEYKNNFTSVFIWATLLLIFGIPHFFTTLIGYSDFSIEVLNKASIFVIIFNLIYFCTKFVLKLKIRSKYTYNFYNGFFAIKYIFNGKKRLTKSNKRFVDICLILLVGIFLITYQKMGGFRGASWGKYFSFYSKGYSNIMLYFVYIYYAISGIALVYIKNGYLFKGLISSTIIICMSIITNTKMMFIPIFLIFIAPFAFNEDRKLSASKISVGIIAAFSVLYIVNFLYVLRSFGTLGILFDKLTIAEVNTEIYKLISNSRGELGLRNAFYLFIEKNNNFLNFNKGHTYIRLLLMWLPTKFSFNLKPSDFAVSMGSAYLGDPNNINYSIHPTFYGNTFANFWWAGVFLGIFWAYLTYFIDKLIHSKNNIARDMLMVSISTSYVMIGRGSVYNSCFTIVVSILIIFSLDLFSRIRVRL